MKRIAIIALLLTLGTLLVAAALVVAQAPASVLFEDDFSSDTGAWTLPSGDYGSAFYEDGWLHVEGNPGGLACACYLMDVDFADLVLEVDTKLVDGSDDNWHMITARYREGEQQDFYRFAIGADGKYGIAKFVDGVVTILADDSSDHIKKGQGATNHMRVECVGSRLSLSVNGHLLAEVTDSSHTAGGIALGCHTHQVSSEVAYDNLVASAPQTSSSTSEETQPQHRH